MAQPYQFSDPDAKVTSPLDRRAPTTLQPSEAPSFKTNVNRNKTRKWVDAKNVAYDGDDWGDYDEDNEYGVEPAPSMPTQAGTSGRNFTAPPPASSLQRSNSFERDDEKRTFSAGVQPPTVAPATVTQPTSHPTNRVVSGISVAPSEGSDTSTNPEHRRDFSPSAMPPPLHTSRGQSASPAPSLTSPIQRPPSAGAYDPRATSPAAVPFIRPAEIYKRMEEAREKQRRASMESNQSATGSEDSKAAHNGPSSSTARRSIEKSHDEHARAGKPALASVPERKSEYGLLDQPGAKEQLAQISKPRQDSAEKYQLPDPTISSSSAFGDDFWSTTPDLSISGTGPSVSKPTAAPVVGPTLNFPASDQAPSRESSHGFRTLVHQAFKPSDASVSKQDSTRSLGTNHSQGTSDISPILSPINDEDQTSPQTPKASQVETKNLPPPPKLDPPAKEKPLPIPVEPTKANPPIIPASKQEEDLPAPPKLSSAANSRSSSPSKGRVNDLAAQFNRKDADSKRSSVVSVGSKHSAAEVKTWETPLPQSAEVVRDKEPARDRSPDAPPKALPSRPKIPGQFDSYAISAAPTPALEEPPPIRHEPAAPIPPPPPKDEGPPDLSPTTSKYPLGGKDKSKSGPLAALAAAGAAIGAAIHQSNSNEEETGFNKHSSSPFRSYGDVRQNRPLPPNRFESTMTEASIPPTPPAKDESEDDDVLPPPPLKIGAPTSTPQKPISANNNTDVTPKANEQRPEVAEGVPFVATDAAMQQLSKEVPPKVVSAAGPVSPTDPTTPSATAAPLPKISRKFSWETESSLAPSSHIDVRNLAAESPASPPIPTSSNAPTRQDTVADNSRLMGEGLHVKNAQPGELPVAATDPTTNLPSNQASPISIDSPYTVSSPITAQHDAEHQHESSSRVPAIGAGLGLAAAAAAVGASTSDQKNKLVVANEPLPMVDLPASPIERPATPLPGSEPVQPVQPVQPVKSVQPVQPVQPVQTSSSTERQPGQAPPALPSFREIMNMKSAEDRIATYNSTRKEWGSMNSGLDNWLAQTLQKHPEHSGLKAEAAQPYMNASRPDLAVSNSPGGRGHMKSGSLGRIFTSKGGQGFNDSPGQAEYSPDSARDKRGSGAGFGGAGKAGKAVGDTIKSFGGKGKNLFNKIKNDRRKGEDVG